jgi:GDP-4-dehydro-6-deoxy-D-mannose reductase
MDDARPAAAGPSLTSGPILVTGALGFVGRHLTALLADEGLATLPLDRTDEDGALAWDLGARDPEAPDRLARLLNEESVPAIVHLAGQSSAGASFGDPAGTVAANLLGTLELLEALRRLQDTGRPVPRLIAIGSAEEYGAAASDAPCREDDPTQPISPYGTSKAAATQLTIQYHRSFGLPVIAVRAFAHTGPGQSTRFVFPSFAAQIAAAEAGRAEPILRVGDLSPARDFLDVRDVVRAYRALLDAGEVGRIYNVCSGSSLTIRDGLEILLGLSTISVQIEPDPALMRPADIPVLVGDPTRLSQATGWAPRIALRDTLHALLEAARRSTE